MQKELFKLKHYFKVAYLLPFGIVFFLSSCFYSGQYNATYEVQNLETDETNKSVQELSTNFINRLAEKNSLTPADNFIGSDTLVFHGKPYHSFKFWFLERETSTIVKLDYWGSFGSRKDQPYKDFFNELNEFMEVNFIVFEKDIQEF